MRYIGLAEFMRMPSGTLYMVEENPTQSFYGFARPLWIKGENTAATNDWEETQPIDFDWGDTSEMISMIDDARMTGENLTLEPSVGRFGRYPKEDTIGFWVLTPHDVARLIESLRQSLNDPQVADAIYAAMAGLDLASIAESGVVPGN